MDNFIPWGDHPELRGRFRWLLSQVQSLCRVCGMKSTRGYDINFFDRRSVIFHLLQHWVTINALEFLHARE